MRYEMWLQKPDWGHEEGVSEDGAVCPSQTPVTALLLSPRLLGGSELEMGGSAWCGRGRCSLPGCAPGFSIKPREPPSAFSD